MVAGVIDDSPSPLVAAVEVNLHGHVAFVQRHLAGMHVDEGPELLIVDSGLPSDTFNKILGARLDETNAEAHIERALAYFSDAGRPFTWWVGPCSRPLDLEARLGAHGLEADEYELGMTIELTELPDTVETPPGATIRRVSTAEELADFAGVLAGLTTPRDDNVDAFFRSAEALILEPDSPMRLFVAYVEGIPGAASELFLGGGVAGIHMVGTSEWCRRRGLGMALTWTALEEGRRAGMTSGVLQASEEGVAVYERLGFLPCGGFVEYGPG